MHPQGTSVRRPALRDAPAAVRDAADALLGGRVVAEISAAAGFTPSTASTVVSARGARLFIKAAPVGAGLGEAVEAGARLADVVGALGPQLVGFTSVGLWRLAAYEVIEGDTLTTWTPDDLAPLLSLIDHLRERTQGCALPDTTPFADAFTPLLGTWQALAAQPGDIDPRAAATVEHIRGRPLPVDVPIPVLAELEGRWLPDVRTGTALHHGDLRRDNVMREPGGRLRIVDWTHLWTAPGWLDLVRLGPDVGACGHDPEVLLRGSCWAEAPSNAVDVVLAGLAGRAWRDGHLPDLPDIPGLRHMQREQGLHTLRWLAARLARHDAG